MMKAKGAHAPIESRSAPVENRGGRPVDGEQDVATMIRQGFENLTETLKGRTAKPEGDKAGETEPEQRAQEPKKDPAPEPAMKAVAEGFRAMKDALTAMSEEFSRRLADQDEKFVGFEQRMKAPAVVTTPKGCFDEFAERILNNPVVKEYMAQGEMPIGARIGKVPSLLKELDRQLEVRAALGITELPNPKIYRPGIIEWMHEEYGLADIIPRVPCEGDVYTVTREPEESGHGHVKTTLNGAIDGDPTPTNTCTLTDSTGFEALMWVRIVLSASIKRRRIVSVNHSTHVLTFATDDLNFDAPDASIVVCEATGVSAESATKPEGYAKVAAGDITLKTIATYLKITNQRLWAKPSLMNWLQTKLMKRFQRQLSFHLLYGTDSATTLGGFFAASGVQTYTWSGGTVGDNRADALMLAELLIPGSGNVAFCMNKNDWRKLQMEKDTTKNYIHTKFGKFDVVDEGPGRRAIVPFPVVIDNNLIDGDALVIAPASAAEIPYNPNAAGFSIGTVDKQFIQNERTALYEEHLNHAILSTQGFVKVTLDAAPSA